MWSCLLVFNNVSVCDNLSVGNHVCWYVIICVGVLMVFSMWYLFSIDVESIS